MVSLNYFLIKKCLIFNIILWTATQSSLQSKPEKLYNSTTKEIICYVSIDGLNSKLGSQINPDLCTIYIFAFGNMYPNGTVVVPGHFRDFSHLKTAKSKILLALGGTKEQSDIFKQIAKFHRSSNIFAESCMKIVETWKFDGISIDWDLTSQINFKTGIVSNLDKRYFIELHRTLKQKLGNKILTSSLGASEKMMKYFYSYDMPRLASFLDILILKTYDMHTDGPEDLCFGVNFNAPVQAKSGDSIEKSIELFIKSGAPTEKIVLGIPFYSRWYELWDLKENTMGSPYILGHQMSHLNFVQGFNQYCSFLNDKSWVKRNNPLAQVPYMYKGFLWVSYEDSKSVAAKTHVALKYNLAGVMIMSVEQDDCSNKCGQGEWPLMKAVKDVLKPKYDEEEIIVEFEMTDL